MWWLDVTVHVVIGCDRYRCENGVYGGKKCDGQKCSESGADVKIRFQGITSQFYATQVHRVIKCDRTSRKRCVIRQKQWFCSESGLDVKIQFSDITSQYYYAQVHGVIECDRIPRKRCVKRQKLWWGKMFKIRSTCRNTIYRNYITVLCNGSAWLTVIGYRKHGVSVQNEDKS